MAVEAQCLIDAGWDISLDADGGYEATVPHEQQGAFDADQRRCSDEATDAIPPPAVGEDDYRRLYAHFLETVKCLEAEGYESAGPSPSEQEFVAEAMSSGGATWNPWDVVGNVSAQAAADLEATCPQLPPDW